MVDRAIKLLRPFSEITLFISIKQMSPHSSSWLFSLRYTLFCWFFQLNLYKIRSLWNVKYSNVHILVCGIWWTIANRGFNKWEIKDPDCRPTNLLKKASSHKCFFRRIAIFIQNRHSAENQLLLYTVAFISQNGYA